jgi:coenzyme F420 hydrogenase subunit beta
VIGLRLEECARRNSLSENLAEGRGAYKRAKSGRLGEPPPVPRVETPAAIALAPE